MLIDVAKFPPQSRVETRDHVKTSFNFLHRNVFVRFLSTSSTQLDRLKIRLRGKKRIDSRRA